MAMNVCIIPARGGSKRIPRKNIKDFNGKPMLAYAIDTAKKTGLFERIVVSTDDTEIAEIAEQFGASVLWRPDELANDYATTVAVIRHAIEWLDLASTMVCCVYPCTPLLTSEQLSDGLKRLTQAPPSGTQAKFCFPVLEFASVIFRGLQLDEQGLVSTIFAATEQQRTQDLRHAYYDAGQFYWGQAADWLTLDSIHNHGIALPLPKHSVVDVDDETDWQFAEQLYQLRFSF